MASAIKETVETLHKFNEFKIRKICQFLVFKVENEAIVVEREGPKLATWQQMVQDLPQDEPRYVAFDLECQSSDGRPQSKIVLLTWCPDAAPLKLKVLYSSSKNNLATDLQGCKTVDATDKDDLEMEEVLKKI